MPTVSWFFGIAIRMFIKDHPPPHFLANYGEFKANVSIETGDVIAELLPATARRLVKEWTALHRDELMANWLRARRNEPLERIAGLDND
jgi:Domain of unknown function (DUF4160)